MSTDAKNVKKDLPKAPTPPANGAATRKPRVRDVRLDERDAQIKAWKDSGKEGIPQSVKAADFKRVAQRRLDDALEAMRLVQQCGRRSAYHYTDEQAGLVIGALKAALDDVERAYAPTGAAANAVTL